VLQEGEFERVGGIKTIRVNVRVITATNRDLREEVENGRFREDLYYRLNVLPIEIPPLRERPEDIKQLMRHYVNEFNARFRKNVSVVPQAVMDTLIAYPWPGNVRELRNVVERAMVLADGDVLELTYPMGTRDRAPCQEAVPEVSIQTYDIAVKEFKKRLIATAVEKTGGNKAGAARILGIQPTYLSRLIRQFGLKI